MRRASVFLFLLVLLSPWAGLPSHASAEGERASQGGTRPAIIAVIENADVRHPEFDLSAAELEERLALVDLPDALVVASRDRFGEEAVPQNTFVRFDSGRVLGYFPSAWPYTHEPRTPVLTEHATATFSRVVGATTGSCPDCLIVAVSGDLSRSLAWIYHQKWIDAVSFSGNAPYTNTQAIIEAVEGIVATGRPVFQSNGNMAVVDDALHMSSALSNAPVISVGSTHRDGSYSAVAEPIRADLATWGYDAPVADISGGTTTMSGTSLSAPWAAGQYGKLLMTGWSEGWFERVVVDGVVRQKVLVSTAEPPAYLQDGHIDGEDVDEWLGTFASYAYGSGPITGPVRSLEPSLWSGHGVLTDQEWSLLAEWPTGLGDEPTMGPGHGVIRQYRATMSDVGTTSNVAWCLAGRIVLPTLHCPDHALRNTDWYQ